MSQQVGLKTITEMTITECIVNQIFFSGQDGYVMATNQEEFDKTMVCGGIYRQAENEHAERQEAEAKAYMADFDWGI